MSDLTDIVDWITESLESWGDAPEAAFARLLVEERREACDWAMELAGQVTDTTGETEILRELLTSTSGTVSGLNLALMLFAQTFQQLPGNPAALKTDA
jgi:hypothetical protein